jgi:drug/metabolite transporter (DMT)-like permease
MLLAVAIGLGAALLFAIAASLQQQASRVAIKAGAARPAGRVAGPLSAVLPIMALLSLLVRTPLWLAGWLTNLFGFLAQATALHLSSVALVQPLMVTQLLFAMPLASAWAHRRPLARDWAAALTICGGLAVFLSVRGTAPIEGGEHRPSIILAGLCILLAVGALVLAARGRPPALHALLVASAAGLCFAMSAVLMKLTSTDLVERGVAATALDWPGYALAASTLLGLVLGQEAFATGSLAAAMAAMTIANPVASYLIGVLAFDVNPPSAPGELAAVAGAMALLAVGVVVLANSPTVLKEAASQPLLTDHQQRRRASAAPTTSPA